MKQWLRWVAVAICAATVCICCACGKTDGEDEMETMDPNWTTLATTARAEIEHPEGVSAATFVPSAQVPQNAELAGWLAESMERAQMSYTVICSQQENSGVWHCWLYAEGGVANATLRFSKDANQADLFLIRYTQENVVTDEEGNASPAEGVWYFTVTAATLPQFEVLTNEEQAGVLVTYADGSVAR